MVGFQGHHSPLHLEDIGDVEVPGGIYDDSHVTTSKKSSIFSGSEFLPSIYNTPNIYITSILPMIYPRLTPKSLIIPSPHNSDTRITTHSSSNKKINNNPLNKNSGISSLDHVTNNMGMSPLNHVSEKSSIEDEYTNFQKIIYFVVWLGHMDEVCRSKLFSRK